MIKLEIDINYDENTRTLSINSSKIRKSTVYNIEDETVKSIEGFIERVKERIDVGNREDLDRLNDVIDAMEIKRRKDIKKRTSIIKGEGKDEA